MKKRFLLPLFLFILPAVIIGAAYAGFNYSSKVDTESAANQGKIDDIKPNFKLDENNYTIYFFPSMQAAKLDYSKYKNAQGLIDEQSIVDAFAASSEKPVTSDTNFDRGIYACGEWQDSGSSNQIISETGLINYNQAYRKYYPKKIETHGGSSISAEQFESLSDPYTNGRDYKNSEWKCDFSGWTANQQSAKDGYASQGEYNYFSALDDLTRIDVKTDDGTISKDKVIFLYPIFTTGKDNNNSSKRNNVVKLMATCPDPDNPGEFLSKSRYLSRVEGAENTTYFYYNNLAISKDDPWSWSLSFAGLHNYGNGWFENWGNYKNNYIYQSNFANSSISEPGIYNLYAYLVRGSFDLNVANNSKFSKDINSDNMPIIYEDRFSAPDNFKVKLKDWWNLGLNFWLFIKIEKVYEFRLAGTEGRGFTFDTAGQLYVSSFDSASFKTLEDSNGVSASTKYQSLNNSLWKMYYLDNVFMEKGKNNIFAEYINPLNSNARYKIRNTVFSILPSDESLSGITNGLQSMGGTALKEELDFINEFETDENVKGNYLGASETSFNRIDKNGTPENYIKDPTNMPNYSDKYSEYFFASEFKYSCFCKVLIKVDFNTSGDNVGEPKSIHVAVAPYHSNRNRIYVYPEKYLNGDFIDFPYYRDSTTKLIDPENDARLIKHQITYFDEKLTENGYILEEQDIIVKGIPMKLSEYLNAHIVRDHLTNKRILINHSYRRHMACYQEGIVSEFDK